MKIIFISIFLVINSTFANVGDLEPGNCRVLEDGANLVDLIGLNVENSHLRSEILCLGSTRTSTWEKYINLSYSNYYPENNLGIELVFRKKSFDLNTVHLYGFSENSEGYTGLFPFGLDVRDSRAHLILKLGIPKKSYQYKESSEIAWDSFESFGYSIFASYKKNSELDLNHDSKIEYISISKLEK